MPNCCCLGDSHLGNMLLGGAPKENSFWAIAEPAQKVQGKANSTNCNKPKAHLCSTHGINGMGNCESNDSFFLMDLIAQGKTGMALNHEQIEAF